MPALSVLERGVTHSSSCLENTAGEKQGWGWLSGGEERPRTYQCADSLIKYSAGQSKPGVQDGHGQGEV